VEVEVSESQYSNYLLMSANALQLENKEDNVNKDDLVVPWPHYNAIWDCSKIHKVYLEANGVIRNRWR
jgi:hypothetical protein